MELLRDQKRVPLPPNTQFAIAKLVLEFRAEMHWPGEVGVGTRAARIGSSSVGLTQALYMGENCVAVANSTVVLMDGTTRQSMPFPPQTVQALARPDQGRVRALAALSLRAPNLRAVAKRAMKVVAAARKGEDVGHDVRMGPTISGSEGGTVYRSPSA